MLRSRDGSPVLIDFGAAREHMGRQSRSITAVLTPGYAPIEQYSAKGRQGPWTDVYALGALAYAALSGRAPEDATERMLEDRLVPVDVASATPVSGGLARAVEAALAVDMRRRPQDVGQWLAMLEKSPLPEVRSTRHLLAVGGTGVAGTGGGAVPAPGDDALVAGKRPTRAVPQWPMWGAGVAVAAVVAVLLLWPRSGEVAETPIVAPGAGPFADAIPTTAASLETNALQFEGALLRVPDITVVSRVGDQAFWTQLPNDDNFFMKMGPELTGNSVPVTVSSGETASFVVGTLRVMDDSTLDAWESQGAFENTPTGRLEAEFAEVFLELVHFEPSAPEVGGDRGGEAPQSPASLESPTMDRVQEAGRVAAEAERAADSIARADAEAQREAEAARQAEEQRFADALHFLIEAAESDDHFRSLGAWSRNFYEQLDDPFSPNSYGIDMSYVPPSYDECELTTQLYGCHVECDSRREYSSALRQVSNVFGDPDFQSSNESRWYMGGRGSGSRGSGSEFEDGGLISSIQLVDVGDKVVLTVMEAAHP